MVSNFYHRKSCLFSFTYFSSFKKGSFFLIIPQTSLPVNEIVNGLAKMGYDVMPSDDAGRFVCNYVYYHSLRFAEQRRIKSLFVHVPLFLTIDEDSQMQFAASLLEVLASLH